jgi:Protein of unknown function (DUF2026)
MTRFLVPLSDYNRIHQVAHGVAKAFGGAEKGCVFFAICGAYILEKHYRIAARPVAGGFALQISDAEIAFFGEDRGDHIVTSADGFHMWVQTETHVIDFMAPIFTETFAERQITVPRRMFQRPINSEASSLASLDKTGDFFTFGDAELTHTLLLNFLSRPGRGDLVEVVDTWFGSRRKPQKKTIQMGDDGGEIYNLSLASTAATGAW